jgi:Leucine-rich repeat (LRR) protein
MNSTLVRIVLGSVVVAVCAALVSGAQNTKPSVSVTAPRVLHFPADRSLGTLTSRPAEPEEPTNTFCYWFRDSNWEPLGEARGDVKVPPGHQVSLSIARSSQWHDLSPLLKLQPDDLYKLSIYGSYTGGAKPGDSCMQYVAHLTGLHALDLVNTGISGAAMKCVSGWKQLQWLTLPGRMDDGGMAVIATLPALRGLYFKENQVTDAGLVHLARLTSLEELELGGARITDAGLAHLAGLPRLRYLVLWGKGFMDAGLKSLKAVPNLEILSLGPLEQVTDAGLVYLSQIPQLKDLDLYRSSKVTDAGISHLKSLPHLRKLDLRHTQVTDAGLAHLKEIKTLEYLHLPEKNISDISLGYLGQLPRLRDLSLPRAHYVDPSKDKGYYTDEGLKALAGLTEMVCLFLGGLGLTDAGIGQLAGMRRLKDLSLYGCDRITGESLKTIGGLRSLETLNIDYARLAVLNLKLLNNLAGLKTLGLDKIVQDNSGLDLSGLMNLRDLSLHLAAKQADGNVAAWQERDIATMGRLTNLRRLQISHTGIPDGNVLRHLTGLTHLERLSIGGNGLTDDEVAYLAQLPSLNSLTLSGTFTDATLTHLRKLQRLGLLDFMSGANFTPRALSDFRASMPNLFLYRDFENKRELRSE